MIFAIDSAKNTKRAAGSDRVRVRARIARRGACMQNGNRINAMRGIRRRRDARLARTACATLHARRDIDIRKTSLDRPDPDGFMASLFSTD
ncbi:hypothetical protein [Burkholderia ubonensis]|uniref:hypothetical protein n=1 Tax=Burkholderia ubonensis TaxID=101571 RepID=UPI0009B41839|nr:hypothetical protein [Burkholderia ubonensis]